MRRSGWLALGLLTAIGAATAACDLNPQPLPPIVNDDDRSSEKGDGTGAGGGFEQAPPAADPDPSAGASGDAGTNGPDGGTTDSDASPDAG